jgi:hypothetical protein
MRLGRAITVWLILMGAEFVHGALRTLFLAPLVGDFRARQIGVFTGSVIILVIACLSIRWMQGGTTAGLGAVGVVWVLLTVGFEVGLGHFGFGYSWERLLSDFNLPRGGLLPIGLVVLALSPVIAARVRGTRSPRDH